MKPMNMRTIRLGLAIAISLFLLSTATASASEWNITLEATSHREDVTFGISPDATDGYDAGIDATSTTPGGPEELWTQMALLTAEGAPMQTWINENNMTWIMKVTINRMATTTISWDSASIPSFLDVTINGTTDMRSVSSMELSGDAGGLVVYEIPITATYKPSYKPWNITLEATSQQEDVTFGISPSATNDYDAGIDEAATTPGGPEELWTQMALLTAEGAPMQTWINEDNMTWIMKVTINRMATTTISWDSASIPSFLDITINGTIDMESANSITLSGNASGSAVHYVPITATIDITAPASITDLQNTTYQETYINWTWTDPADTDFSKVMVYLNGNFQTNVSAGVEHYNATGLAPSGTGYTISTHTVDDIDNINGTWVSHTAMTKPSNMTVTATPSSVTVNTSTPVLFDVTSDGTPVVGATVTLTGAFDNVSITGEDGTVTIDVNATRGMINVTATKGGYNTASTVVLSSIIVDIPLSAGWNMVSLPVNPTDPSVDSVFADVTMYGKSVYGYGASGYEAVTTVEPKVGYWVYSASSTTITVEGSSITNTVDLQAGWNMIGLPVNPTNPSVDSVFADVTMYGKSVYGYGASGYEAVTTVEPKVGYWVYSASSTTITIEGTIVTS